VNTVEPQISGSAIQGQTLTATTGTWTGTAITYAFQWRRCPKDGGFGDASNCAVIAGATTNTYMLANADVGFTIRVRVTATNVDGSASKASNPTAVVAAAGVGPVNTAQPTISGTPQVGQTLTASTGTWTGTAPITYAFQWRRCPKDGGFGDASNCAVIAGATTNTYMLASGDVGFTIRVRATATNTGGSASKATNPTAVIAPAPPATGCPSGPGPVQAADVKPPARLLIDQQQANPPVIRRGTQQILLRYHVSDTCGQSVQGALVYATAVPFSQLSVSPEQPTGPSGYADLSFRTLAGFPASPHQQLIAIFVRARKLGENPLAGISTRRLFSIRVSR
jgi:hypothetical protein